LSDPEFDIPEFSYNRRRREPAYDPLMRRIALGAGGVAVLIIATALVWSGVKPGLGFGPPPVITAPPGPLRVVPSNPGGITLPGADQQIMSGQSSAAPSALAPSAPAPDISAFQPPPSAPSPPQQAAPASQPAPTPAVIDSNVQVQLAAAVDPAGARTAWTQLSSKMPSLLAGRTPLYTHAKIAGVEFWRLRLAGFADEAAARRFCDAVKAQGGACTVAAF
jgi:hypothetical protein